MPIATECPSCRATFRVKDEHAGKRGRCPKCKHVFVVPAPGDDGDLVPLERVAAKADAAGDEGAGYVLAGGGATRAKAARVREGALPDAGAAAKAAAAAAPTVKSLTSGEILSAFRGEIEPVRPTALYRFWVAAVAGVMVLLPVVYVALIGLVVAGLVYHAVNHVTLFQAAGSHRGSLKGAALVYLAPLVAGGMVVAFMLKPLFARPPKGAKPRSLDPQVEPLLFAFVDGVCASVGSPRPTRIDVSSDVNASAHLEGGLLGLFRNELVLTVGLPLAAGLDLRSFAGVLAHEFGHFSQGAGMRLYVLIVRVNRWFARVVYQRDAWDEALAAHSTGGNVYVMAFALLARAAVWFTRRILWALMYLGHVVSGFLSRQMEYDADRYEARMVGGRTFARTAWRLRELNLAEGGAYSDLGSSWRQRRMPDNFPKLVLANVPQIPKEVADAYRKAMGTAETGLFDTHPADKDRIARARAEEPGEGIFLLEGATTDLFRDFDALARRASLDLYRAHLGPEITKDQLYAVSELVENQSAEQEGYAAAGRVFLGALSLSQRLPLPWDPPKLPASPGEAKAALAAARDDLQAGRDDNLGAGRRVVDARERLYRAEAALVMLAADIKIDAESFGLTAPNRRSAEAARDGAEADLKRIAADRGPFASAAARRVTRALAILQADAIAGAVPDGRDRREEARALYPCVAHLGANVAPETAVLARHRRLVLGMVENYQAGKGKDPKAADALLRAASTLRDALEEFRWKVGETISYPFEHASEDVTLARYALPPVLPEKGDVGGLLDVSQAALDKLNALYARALGRVAVTVEEVETALGFPRIEVETEPESESEDQNAG